jgi:hypothetical protein
VKLFRKLLAVAVPSIAACGGADSDAPNVKSGGGTVFVTVSHTADYRHL